MDWHRQMARSGRGSEQEDCGINDPWKESKLMDHKKYASNTSKHSTRLWWRVTEYGCTDIVSYPYGPGTTLEQKYCLRYQKLAAGLWPVIELLLSSQKDAIYGAIRCGNSEGRMQDEKAGLFKNFRYPGIKSS